MQSSINQLANLASPFNPELHTCGLLAIQCLAGTLCQPAQETCSFERETSLATLKDA